MALSVLVSSEYLSFEYLSKGGAQQHAQFSESSEPQHSSFEQDQRPILELVLVFLEFLLVASIGRIA